MSRAGASPPPRRRCASRAGAARARRRTAAAGSRPRTAWRRRRGTRARRSPRPRRAPGPTCSRRGARGSGSGAPRRRPPPRRGKSRTRSRPGRSRPPPAGSACGSTVARARRQREWRAEVRPSAPNCAEVRRIAPNCAAHQTPSSKTATRVLERPRKFCDGGGMWPDDEPPPPLRSRGRLSSESCWCRAGFCCGRAGRLRSRCGASPSRSRGGFLPPCPGSRARNMSRGSSSCACGFGGRSGRSSRPPLERAGSSSRFSCSWATWGERAEEARGWRRWEGGGGVGACGACGACGVPGSVRPGALAHMRAHLAHRELAVIVELARPSRRIALSGAEPRAVEPAPLAALLALDPARNTAKRRRRRRRRRAAVAVARAARAVGDVGGGGGRRRRRRRAADSRKLFRVDVRGLLRRREAAEEAALAVVRDDRLPVPRPRRLVDALEGREWHTASE